MLVVENEQNVAFVHEQFDRLHHKVKLITVLYVLTLTNALQNRWYVIIRVCILYYNNTTIQSSHFMIQKSE